LTRVIAGEYGGRRLVTPGGSGTRPTSDRVREALFNTLGTMIELSGARVADLYAGSGAVGLEALSRGASRVVLVEADPRAARAARANIAALGARTASLSTTTVERAVAARPPHEFDLVFADPPYDLADGELAEVLAAVAANGWLAPDAVLVVERSSRSPEPAWPRDVTPERGRRYGETTLWYGRRS
jgi:16S rRNA (guanine966-N2)-methyltransferase